MKNNTPASFIARRVEKCVRLALLVILLLLYTQVAYGQAGNDFPSFPSLPPWPPPTTPTPFAGTGDIKGDWVWGPQNLMPVLKGDTVRFRVIMEYFPGWLVLEPWLEDGTPIRFIGPVAGGIQFGNWCTDCEFEFIAGSDYPVLGLHATAPYRFIETHGAYIVISQLLRGPQPLLKQLLKDRAGGVAMYMGLFGEVLKVSGGYVGRLGVPGAIPVGVLIELAAAGAKQWAQPTFEKMQSDPWDDNYGSIYEPYADGGIAWEMSFYCSSIEQNDDTGGTLPWLCKEYMQQFLIAEAYWRAVLVTIDRMESCALIGDSCQYWQRDWGVVYFHEAANQTNLLAWWTDYLAEHMIAYNLWANDPDTGWDLTSTVQALAGQYRDGAYLMWEVE